MSRGLLVNLALSLGVTLVLLALLEGGARVVEEPGPDRPQVADYIWNWDEKMPGGFFVVNVDAVGWPPWQVYNDDGLRDRTRTRDKPAGFTRIAFLGDSVTLGAMIDPAEAFPQLLEARYASEGRRAEGARFPVVEVEPAPGGGTVVSFSDARYRDGERLVGPSVRLDRELRIVESLER